MPDLGDESSPVVADHVLGKWSAPLGFTEHVYGTARDFFSADAG
ncbi:hypothetical protein [Mycolicibacterium mucogenicum]|nr:hypothetical protein [Mycolicibacterium mucogenicum]